MKFPWPALLAGVFGAACAATPPTTETLQLSIGQPPATALGGVRVALVEVSDQRCPVDVNCVWAGYAKVTLEVSPPGAAAERVVIGMGGPRAGIPGDADLGPYHFSLVALEPRPSQRAPVPPSSYRATVLVSRR